jgi:hypothetical protein
MLTVECLVGPEALIYHVCPGQGSGDLCFNGPGEPVFGLSGVLS